MYQVFATCSAYLMHILRQISQALLYAYWACLSLLLCCLTKATWEASEVLPIAAIQEYEAGIRAEIVEEHSDTFGMGSNTFIVNLSSDQQVKRVQRNWTILENTTGYFFLMMLENCILLFKQSPELITCNTVKDKNIPHTHRSAGTPWVAYEFTCNAGILAGIWPCGIVTFLSELVLSSSVWCFV